MTGRTFTGEPLTPGVNVDGINYDAGLRELRACGYEDAHTVMVIGMALQRHARGEEESAERLAIDKPGGDPQHGYGVDLTSWKRVLAAAIVYDPVNGLLPQYKRATYLRAEGYVWCHVHGNVHDDTTNPYDTPSDRCPRREHRPVYYRARKGDFK